MLKVIILILLAGIIISLFTGLTFLFKDTNQPDSKRTWYALGVRITLAVLLILTIVYGLWSGELRFGGNAPWHGERHPPGEIQNSPSSPQPDGR